MFNLLTVTSCNGPFVGGVNHPDDTPKIFDDRDYFFNNGLIEQVHVCVGEFIDSYVVCLLVYVDPEMLIILYVVHGLLHYRNTITQV